MMNRRSPEVEEVRRGGFMSSQSQRWQRGGGEEHAAWIRRPDRSSSSGGWGPSGQPSLSSSSKRSFGRPVNAHAGHQQKTVSHPDAAAAVHNVLPLRATASTSSPHQTPNSDELKRRQLNAILNKLAPRNLHKLSRNVLEVNIDNVDTLSWFVSQIFHRGLTEPTFCQIYAELSSHLQGALMDFTVDHEKITFRRSLLNKCQEEFERGLRNEVEAGKTEEDEALAHQTDERSVPARRRMLGSTRFIGELYKNGSLSEHIVHHCIITKLIGDPRTPDEGKIEALCKLMNAIGYKIDHRLSKQVMDAYFDTMEKLSTDEKLSWRVRFLLRDLIELRENKWHSGGELEHAAWISSSGGWGPSGQPSLSSSSKRSFAEHQQKAVSHPDAAAVQQYTKFNEVREALQEATNQLAEASVQLKKNSEEYYFPDRELISWRVSHDVCVDMQNMSISLGGSARRFQQVIDGQTPSDLSFDDPPSDYPTDWQCSSDSGSHYDPRFDDP